jgi:hypothetical protein
MTAKTPMIMASSPNIPILELPPSANLESSFPDDKGTFTTGGPDASRDDDEDWALFYIDVVHLDPIVEAIDDDFSGFISIHEANRFAIARPKSWRYGSVPSMTTIPFHHNLLHLAFFDGSPTGQQVSYRLMPLVSFQVP